jgi:2-haloacid dehalogenase
VWNVAGAVRHFVFDAFGTLFDVHSAARGCAQIIGPQWPRVSEIWRNKQLEYSWIYAGIGRHMPFREATRQGLIYALQVTGLDTAMAREVLAAYSRLAPFAEVPEVLVTLKARGDKLAILSNGDPDMLDELVANAGLANLFDAVLSVEAAGTFKPAPQVYALCQRRFGVAASELTFMSSNRWDIAGARAFGMTPIWVNRSGAPDEYPDLAPVRIVGDLSALLDGAPEA